MCINTLVVDDEICLLSSLSRLLEDRGCRVTTAQNGIEAVRIISEREELGEFFDLVIADAKMPLMGGIELIKWAQRFHKGTKAILISGSDKEGLLAELDGGEDADFLQKPFTSKKLFAMMAARLGGGKPKLQSSLVEEW